MFYFVKIRKYCVWIFFFKNAFLQKRKSVVHTVNHGVFATGYNSLVRSVHSVKIAERNRYSFFVFFFFHFTHCRFKSRATDISSLLRCPKPKNILSGEYTVQSSPLFGGFFILAISSAPPFANRFVCAAVTNIL